MLLVIGQEISTTSIQGEVVTGSISAILENTIILTCQTNSYVVSKNSLLQNGYLFLSHKTEKKRPSQPICASNTSDTKK